MVETHARQVDLKWAIAGLIRELRVWALSKANGSSRRLPKPLEAALLTFYTTLDRALYNVPCTVPSSICKHTAYRVSPGNAPLREGGIVADLDFYSHEGAYLNLEIRENCSVQIYACNSGDPGATYLALWVDLLAGIEDGLDKLGVMLRDFAEYGWAADSLVKARAQVHSEATGPVKDEAAKARKPRLCFQLRDVLFNQLAEVTLNRARAPEPADSKELACTVEVHHVHDNAKIAVFTLEEDTLKCWGSPYPIEQGVEELILTSISVEYHRQIAWSFL